MGVIDPPFLKHVLNLNSPSGSMRKSIKLTTQVVLRLCTRG